ncbi:MAG: hypothetical protein GY737_25155 [Desulfobacteraceae bacterium]|nr:hypothetical protein [Desulfobacteraceae bacterium]
MKSAVNEDAKSAVNQPTEAELWAQFVSGWNNCCKAVVLNVSESSLQGSSTGLATRRVPRLSIDIDGVSFPCSALPDSGASMSVLVPSSLIPVIYKGRLSHVFQNLKHVPSTPIRQVEGQQLSILGSLLATVTLCGQQLSTTLYICPGMAANDGIIVGCHSLRRLGFSLCGPDGIDYLMNSDTADNLRIEQSSSIPAPEKMPSLGEESEESAPADIRPNGRDSEENTRSNGRNLQSESSLREQEVAQAPSSEVSGARQTKKKKPKKKKGKGRPPADVHVGEVDRTHVHVGEGDVHEGEGHKADSQDVGEGATYVGDSEQGKNVVQQMSCFKCSVVSEQFVVPETSSKLKVQVKTTPEEGVVYLFSP